MIYPLHKRHSFEFIVNITLEIVKHSKNLHIINCETGKKGKKCEILT